MIRWTREKEDELRELRIKHSPKEIAKMWGSTRTAIQQRCNILGIRVNYSERRARFPVLDIIRHDADLRERWNRRLPHMKEQLRAEMAMILADRNA